jgi:hypothetical protein
VGVSAPNLQPAPAKAVAAVAKADAKPPQKDEAVSRAAIGFAPMIAPAPPVSAAAPPDAIAAASFTAAPAVVRPEPPAILPDEPVAARPEPAQAAPPTAAPVVRVDEEAAIRATLGRYRDAYEHLDAGAAKRVWPGVDERALSKAFSNLESQSITFNDCRTTLGTGSAIAFCRGTATYVGRFGSRNGQTQDRQWAFSFRKDGNAWTIESVQVR